MPAETKNVSSRLTEKKIRAAKTRKPAVGQLMPDAAEWGVKECLDWRTNSAKRQPAKHQATNYLLPKAQLGRALPLGYGVPDDFIVTDKPVDSNGTAVEALRGWPCLQTSPRPLLEQYRQQVNSFWRKIKN
jgi:hypothetical protein